jgi:hypothetical protein
MNKILNIIKTKKLGLEVWALTVNGEVTKTFWSREYALTELLRMELRGEGIREIEEI